MQRKVHYFSCLATSCSPGAHVAGATAWAPQPLPNDPRMAPLFEYLMSGRATKAALARSAVAAAISDDATVVHGGPSNAQCEVSRRIGAVERVDDPCRQRIRRYRHAQRVSANNHGS